MAVTNLRQFSADLQKFARSINVQFETIVRKLAIDLFTKIVERTPVDTGRSRASWTLNAGRPSYKAQPQSFKADPNSATSAALNQTSKVAAMKPFEEMIWIANGLEHLPWLENGTSKIRPYNMVELSIIEVEAEVEAEIKRRAQ